MTRARLSDEERERRRKERNRRSFSDAGYRHYDAKKEGFGSFEEWVATAASAWSGTGGFRRIEAAKAEPAVARQLGVLGLEDLPQEIAGLKAAFRATLFKVHPDHGGTEAATIAAKDAFDALARHYD